MGFRLLWIIVIMVKISPLAVMATTKPIELSFPYTKLLGLMIIVPVNILCSLILLAFVWRISWKRDVVYEIKSGLEQFLSQCTRVRANRNPNLQVESCVKHQNSFTLCNNTENVFLSGQHCKRSFYVPRISTMSPSISQSHVTDRLPSTVIKTPCTISQLCKSHLVGHPDSKVHGANI